MGLDSTHNCWHGAYSAFMRWRQMLAQVAGLPPLSMMEGFCNIRGYFGEKEMEEIDNVIPFTQRYGNTPVAHAREIIWNLYLEKFELPIKWDYYKEDPLVILLHHSDCEGDIKCKDCGPLADRLEELLPNIPDGSGGGHIGNWKDKTKTFIDGLRLASEKREDVEFH